MQSILPTSKTLFFTYTYTFSSFIFKIPPFSISSMVFITFTIYDFHFEKLYLRRILFLRFHHHFIKNIKCQHNRRLFDESCDFLSTERLSFSYLFEIFHSSFMMFLVINILRRFRDIRYPMSFSFFL